MPPHVIVSFDQQTEFRFPLEASALVGVAAEVARRWFEREYAALGIESGSPLGKVLVIDKILDVARHGGARRFAGHGFESRQRQRMDGARVCGR